MTATPSRAERVAALEAEIVRLSGLLSQCQTRATVLDREVTMTRNRNRELTAANDKLVTQARGWAEEHCQLTRDLDLALKAQKQLDVFLVLLAQWRADPLRPYLPSIHLLTALELS